MTISLMTRKLAATACVATLVTCAVFSADLAGNPFRDLAADASNEEALALVPRPQKVTLREGRHVGEAEAVSFGIDASLPKEGYRLKISPDGIVVASSDAAGAFYARQTLKQLARREKGKTWFPCVEIEDAPRYGWRGILLDECRHFFGKETVKQLIDIAAEHKYNVFHWHLMDDEGWRVESKAFPDLVKYGAVRPKSQCHGSSHSPKHVRYNDVPYGPFFYTREELREVVAYAAERHIAVMPEVEFPAHARAALAAYPQFSCRGTIEPRTPRCIWGGEKEVFCAGNDEAIRFLERLIDETCELFPFAYVHIGGDECPKDRWKECPKCQKRIRDLGLGDEEGLQKWMTQHFTRYLAQKGRHAVGWDEILSAGVPKGTVVMSWRGAKGGIEAANAGSDVIMTPNTHCYLDYWQGLREDPFQYIGGPNGRRVTLEKAYSFDPCEGIPESGRPHVLGGQANCWSEYTWNEYDLAWKTWPRACAIAEALWTAPAAPRDFAGFRRRMEIHRKRLIAAYVNCAPVAAAAIDAPVKVLYLGNSMTIHGPLAKIGWTNDWGMAASAREKDYVHVVARGIEARTGRKVDIRVRGLADFERNLASFDMARQLAADRAWGADYTVIAIGENSPVPKTAEEQALFKAKMLELNRMFAPKDGRETVVRGVFTPCMIKDRLQREAAAEAGVKYVRTWDLGATKECKAIGKFWHSGVAGHPGDKGMALMAERILDAFFPPPGLPIEWKGDRLAEWKPNAEAGPAHVEDGSLVGTVTGFDGQLYAKLQTPFEARGNQFFKLRLKAQRGGSAQLFWVHQGASGPTEKFQTKFVLEGDGAWHDYKVNPRWMGPEKIAALRFDFPAVFAGGTKFEIAEIAVAEEGEATEPFLADEANFVAFSLKAPPGINYYALEWSSSKSSASEIHFTTAPDGETHEYMFNLWRGWWGGIVDGFKVRQPFAGKELKVGNLRFQKEKPVLPPDPVITSAIPSEAVPRAGRPFVLEAVVRNFGTVEAKNLKFAFDGLPAGVKPLEPDTLSPKGALPGSNGEESLNHDCDPQLPHERVFKLRLSDLGVGKHVFGLSVSADGVAPRRIEVVADVKPSLGLAKLGYPAEPKPVDTAPYTIGALMFPGWVSHKWHAVWSHDHARKPVLGWYDETSPETVDWQIKYLVENGISFVSVCWYWRNGVPSRNHWMESFVKARYSKYLKWHIMWDNGYNSVEDQRKLAHYWCERYFAHPQYHKIDGMPVVAICSPDGMERRTREEGGAKRLLDLTREIARSYGFPGVYFVAMRGMGSDLEDPVFLKQFADYGFDVTTVYGFRGGIPGSEEFASKQRTFRKLADISPAHWRALHKNGTIPFWPSISTGYDDRPWRGERVLEIRGYNVADFARICREARKFSDESGVRTFLLGPLDEWGEGSIGYPNHAHGFGIFEAVRDTFGKKPEGGWPVNYAPEDVGLECPQRTDSGAEKK